MKLTRRARPEQSETIVALIDVVFFLLVFFMLIGRMDATAPFDVVPPTAQTGADMPAGGATLSIAADGALAFDGVPVTLPEFQAQLTARLLDAPDLLVRVNADRAAELRNVLPLIGMAENLGAPDVVLVVTPEDHQ